MASPPTDSNATRFGVRLHAPDGSNREALEDLARVLSTFARRPTGSLAEQLSKGPIVLEEGLTENEARELVEVFRQMGALAELVEPSSRSTRPLFAQSEAAQIASAWRQVVSGTRPVSSVGAAAAAAEPGETRRMSALGPGLAEPPTTRFQAASAAPPIVAAPAVRDVATRTPLLCNRRRGADPRPGSSPVWTPSSRPGPPTRLRKVTQSRRARAASHSSPEAPPSGRSSRQPDAIPGCPSRRP